FQFTHPEISANRLSDIMGRPDVFTMVVLGFRSIAVSAFYILALSSLALHLSHGIQSMFQSVGLNTEKTELLITRAGFIAAIVLFLGFIAIPVAVIAGLVR
ncbi:MAG: succinate dehydrogenase/fumarate reductase cytochrome b subunit, partial [Nitrospirota bacterium]|nr:succinate dehydrogenase/fumarate reductase cytochrome b subunit [Nitrospirota bacterium]